MHKPMSSRQAKSSHLAVCFARSDRFKDQSIGPNEFAGQRQRASVDSSLGGLTTAGTPCWSESRCSSTG